MRARERFNGKLRSAESPQSLSHSFFSFHSCLESGSIPAR